MLPVLFLPQSECTTKLKIVGLHHVICYKILKPPHLLISESFVTLD